MGNTTFSAQDIADFLHQHPTFLEQHADVFAELRVPHPYAGRAISLGERQILTLRAKIKELEWRLSGLIHQARGNENISNTLTAWCTQMLAEADATQLPRHVVQSLSKLFDLPAVALRLWDLPHLPEGEFTADITPDARAFAARLNAPVCGPAADQPVTAWLPKPSASLAIVPLTHQDARVGLLVLGSDDPERFTPDMGTAFLSMLGELTAAALSRLR